MGLPTTRGSGDGEQRTEEAQVESERRFRAVFDGALDAMLLADDAGRYVEANNAACALLGRTREEILRARVGGFSGPGVDPQCIWDTLRANGRATGRWRVVRSDGTTREVEYAITADVLPGLHLSALRDVTERTAVEAELSREREILKAIMDNIPVMISFADRGGRVEWINRQFERVLGWALPEAGEVDMMAAALPDAERRQEARDFYRTLAPGWRDFPTRTKDGRMIHTAWANVLLSDQRVICIGQDVTERKRTEEDRERRVAQLQALADAALKIGKATSVAEITTVAAETAREIIARSVSDKYDSDFGDADEAILVQLAQLASEAVENARLLEEISAGRARLEALSRRLVNLQEEERREIAHGLHDEVGQLLTGLGLMIEDETPTSGRREETRRVVNEIIGRVRDLSMNLRPPMLDPLGLLPTLLWQIERFESQMKIEVAFQHANLERRFPAPVELTAFRVVQEALTNIARHAGVTRAKVEVWAQGDSLGARIADEGRGFIVDAALTGHSSGLAGLLERSRLLGGRLVIESAPGAGTRLFLDLPLSEARAGEAS